jgi:hypothetical protein
MGTLFTFVLASALWRQLDISCGCFSSSAAGKIGYMTLIRAMGITLLSAAAYGAALFPQPKEWPPMMARSKADAALQARPIPNDSGFVLPQE